MVLRLLHTPVPADLPFSDRDRISGFVQGESFRTLYFCDLVGSDGQLFDQAVPVLICRDLIKRGLSARTVHSEHCPFKRIAGIPFGPVCTVRLFVKLQHSGPVFSASSHRLSASRPEHERTEGFRRIRHAQHLSDARHQHLCFTVRQPRERVR